MWHNIRAMPKDLLQNVTVVVVTVGIALGFPEATMGEDGERPGRVSPTRSLDQEKVGDEAAYGNELSGRRDPFRSLLEKRSPSVRTPRVPRHRSVPRAQDWVVLGIMVRENGWGQAIVELGTGRHVLLSREQPVGSTSWRVKAIAREALVLERADGRRLILPVGKPVPIVP